MSPYLPFIIGFIVIIINLILIFKSGINWFALIALNLILSLMLNLFGLSEYDLLTTIITKFIAFIGDTLAGILTKIWDIITPGSCS